MLTKLLILFSIILFITIIAYKLFSIASITKPMYLAYYLLSITITANKGYKL